MSPFVGVRPSLLDLQTDWELDDDADTEGEYFHARAERRVTQIEAARVLSPCIRQAQRLYAAVCEDGADGLVSRKRGRPHQLAG
jgi:hypothetical protein